ncbi:DUF2252 domain-containing protein [Methylocystis parvus]|uniref:DUF2252 domain-containing protein n=1 Tax=Methylocystis parvus TaxID=134 RepID=A0A6B8M6J8_9HYPH|nr:DUF2252 domain-containing protein [Methylocystis parvus]QGM98046.1 DUF2252 domain-containing protein [Methylocystis parvus]WBK01635.1 DUF2252 domain-containing protein [Methylocystis parvus OBBP]
MGKTDSNGRDDVNATGLSRRERYAFGKSLREAVPREALADYIAPDDRKPLSIIRETASVRLPSLRPLRRELMMQSPFAFLRGAADVMAFDLSRQLAPGVKAQAAGDCHIMNFGAYSSPENNVLFDVNDFDESLPDVDIGYDLRRLATNVAVAALEMDYARGEARELARRAIKSYRTRMLQLAVMSPYEIWNVRVHLKDVVKTLRDRVLHEKLAAAIYEGKGPEDRTDGLPKIQKTGGGWRFVDKPPKLRHLDRMTDDGAHIDLPSLFERLVRERLPEPVSQLFARYRLCDTAFKAVGVGSVGVFCGVALYMSADEEPLALQIKAAQPSALERFGAGRWKGAQGMRVVSGQRVMQAASDMFLAAADGDGFESRFYMRHLKTRRLGGIAELLKDQAFPGYVELCGNALARAHARSSQPASLAGYMGKGEAFDDALASFAMLYAKQTRKDYQAFCDDDEAV